MDIIAKIRMQLPKVITIKTSLNDWITDYKRDKLPIKDKQEFARYCYTNGLNQDDVYSSIFTYMQFNDNKFKIQ